MPCKTPHLGTLSRRTMLAAALSLTALGGQVLVPTAAAAQSPDFSGETISIYVPFGEGGGTDVFARTIARYLGAHLPGEPSIVIQNLPGAGGIAGVNRFEREAEPDGLTLLATSASTMLAHVTGAGGARFSPETWIPALVAPHGAVAYVRPETGMTVDMDLADRIETLRSADMIYGDGSPTSAPLRFLLTLDLLELYPATVWGLDGGGARRQAFERGEFQLNYDSASAYQQRVIPMIEEGSAVPFLSMGMFDEQGNIARDPNFPDVPTVVEYYQALNDGQKPEGAGWDAWRKLFILGSVFNKALFLPEGTPDETVQAYSDAFTALLSDPEFLATGEGQLIEAYAPLVGPASADVLLDAITVSDEVYAHIDAFLSEHHGVSLRN